MQDKNVQEILDKLSIFNNIYEAIRFVDPVLKKVVTKNDYEITELPIKCYDFWRKNKICDNCISIRSYNENKTFVKLEYLAGKIYMVASAPVHLDGRTIVIELMNEVTDSMIFVNGDHDNSLEVYSMIDNINDLVLKDPLTHVFNKRYISERLPIDILSAAFSNQHISVIMVDIDCFKEINDTFGHLAGDEILKVFADKISTCLQRENDWVARFGGEEFLVCLPGSDTKKSIEIAEIMRKVIGENEIIFRNNKIKITASFGVFSIKPKHDCKVETIIEEADKMLYKAKSKGRNRVEF